MSIFVTKEMVKEVEIEGVKFRISPLTGDEEDALQDYAGEYKIIDGEEKFVTNYRKMRAEKILCALSGDGCGWSVGEQVTKENIALLKKDIRDKLCEEIDKLSIIDSKKKEQLA